MSSQPIPRIIHYCWFGGNPLPELAQRCMASWRKYFPGWEIREWNEENFDVRAIEYTSQAYDAKKYAFVSDYARFWILYRYGGIYFDTDVEVVRPFDGIVSAGPYIGCEVDANDVRDIMVNPGLGVGAVPGMKLYKEMMGHYENASFLKSDGSCDLTNVVARTTSMLIPHGLRSVPGIQDVAGMRVYPREYFNPYDYYTGRVVSTVNTHSIHWYAQSWLPPSPFKDKCRQIIHRIIGRRSLRNMFLPKFLQKTNY